MPYFDNEGVKIYYEIEGTGPDLLMIHGFAANIEMNWKISNWIKTLKDENRLILMDCRGHGKSDKPTDPAQYGLKMGEDVIKLMDHLSIQKANLFGYSMGSRITLNLLIREPNRINCAILGGFVIPPSNKHTTVRYKSVIDALKAESLDQVKDLIGREFRKFAESTGANLNALAAVMGSYVHQPEDMFTTSGRIKKILRKISIPLLTVVGSEDFLPGDKALIAKLVPGACHFQIQGRDHLTVVPDPRFHMVVKAFLNFVNHS
ncbi:MAG: alpha/beta hydrolase [Promethearchaeota archaeon]|nr:MAG: alpha/beta hydrolase [Candidatus Lokiarchaeota archaeon]